MMGSRSSTNRQAHHTDEYEYDHLIVRRGQPFDIRLQFQQDYDPEEHRVCLEFLIVGHPDVVRLWREAKATGSWDGHPASSPQAADVAFGKQGTGSKATRRSPW
ncbi:UNVERIFIED_CONTAM: hypothetical protein K2H54_042799 [Gekko kuhli]